MNRKTFTKVSNQISNFILGNGFYIALTLCVSLIVLSGYYLMSAVTPSVTLPASGTPEIIIPLPQDEPVVSQPDPILPSQEETPPIQEESPPAQALTPTQALTPEPEPEVAEDAEVETHVPDVPLVVSFVWPTQGEILQAHSLEVLSYNAVMGDWRTHNGIAISAPEGAEVLAVAEGQVLSVVEDDLTGVTITMMHQNGVESAYANLAPTVYVAEGEWVLAGQILATVGNSALGQGGSDPHLSFTMSQSGYPVDPMDFLPEQES